ncbi:Undecaprenyl-phosphate mannosyltransferase [compost metagenome]
MTRTPAQQEDFAVVIPAFNEGRTIRELVERALLYVRHVIVVDDGSNDDTSAALSGLDVILLRHELNQGKAASLWDGMHLARSYARLGIITLDGDGQHRPEDIPRLISRFRETSNTIVIGSRLHEKEKIPRARYNANQLANFLISWTAGYRISDSQSGFRIYPADLLESIKIDHQKSSCFVFESEILIEAAYLGVRSVPVKIPAIYAPHARASHFRPVLDIARIARMLTRKLLARGLYLRGLIQSLQDKQ